MKKIVLTFLIAFSIIAINYAQDYNTGIGLRGGFESGITLKHFISEKSALEGIVATRWRGVEFTGLYEIHNQAFHVERLNWYFGFGAHVGFWNGNYAGWGTPGNHYAVLGIDGILGMEYNLREIPVNIGIDWKPALNVLGYQGFWVDGGAVSIRYIF
jgi:hypothetical protein